MARKLRTNTSFSLSFLDIMSCGLGAAVLIFLLLKHVVDGPSKVTEVQTYAEVSLLEEEIKDGEAQLVRIRNTISDVSDETVVAQGLARQIQDDINQLKSQLEALAPDSNVDIPGIRNKIARLEQQKLALQKTAPAGNNAYQYTGDGERQYLTGLKIGGERVLIMIDASASMLDETIVNIIRRRNMPEDIKMQAPKWQRAQAIAQWVVSNLPLSSDFQVVTFNTGISPVYGTDVNQWYEVSDYGTVSKVVAGVMQTVPENGTNMSQAFVNAMRMTPRPDNIYLVTDGLPTMGDDNAQSGSVSGVERYRLFWQAVDQLLPGIPVNTLLLPLEGDPYAAGSFWGLAQKTRGSLITPARDWP